MQFLLCGFNQSLRWFAFSPFFHFVSTDLIQEMKYCCRYCITMYCERDAFENVNCCCRHVSTNYTLNSAENLHVLLSIIQAEFIGNCSIQMRSTFDFHWDKVRRQSFFLMSYLTIAFLNTIYCWFLNGIDTVFGAYIKKTKDLSRLTKEIPWLSKCFMSGKK